MMKLQRFWKALDKFPGAAADARTWRDELQDEWPSASRYLRSTGRQALQTDCPSPGDEGCPRQIIKRANGGFRAICGSPLQLCRPLDLQQEDVAILSLDQRKLIEHLSKVFDAPVSRRGPGSGRVYFVGRHLLEAGLGVPILLVVADPLTSVSEVDFEGAGLSYPATIILAPTACTYSAALQSKLSLAGHQLIFLDEVLLHAADGFLIARPLSELYGDLHHRLTVTIPSLNWRLPSDAQWAEISVKLVADEVINVSFRGETRRWEPSDLGLVDRRIKRPGGGWTLLKLLAAGGGFLAIAQATKRPTIEKQKERLSEKLTLAFGLEEQPITYSRSDGGYRTEFMIRDDRSKLAKVSIPVR